MTIQFYNNYTVCWDPRTVPPWSRALHHVVVSDPVMGGFVRPHGGTKTSKGRDRKIMFLRWAGLPKVEIWPYLGFHKFLKMTQKWAFLAFRC